VCWADGSTEGIIFVFSGHTIACDCCLGRRGLCVKGSHINLYRAANARGGDNDCDRGAIDLEQFLCGADSGRDNCGPNDLGVPRCLDSEVVVDMEESRIKSISNVLLIVENVLTRQSTFR